MLGSRAAVRQLRRRPRAARRRGQPSRRLHPPFAPPDGRLDCLLHLPSGVLGPGAQTNHGQPTCCWEDWRCGRPQLLGGLAGAHGGRRWTGSCKGAGFTGGAGPSQRHPRWARFLRSLHSKTHSKVVNINNSAREENTIDLFQRTDTCMALPPPQRRTARAAGVPGSGSRERTACSTSPSSPPAAAWTCCWQCMDSGRVTCEAGLCPEAAGSAAPAPAAAGAATASAPAAATIGTGGGGPG